jgi:hypothetical protein
MVPPQELEDRLRRLGKSLPKCESLPDRVLSEIEARSVVPLRHRPWRRAARFLAGAAALLLITAIGWLALTELGKPRTLYAAVIEALRNASTFHLTLTIEGEKGPIVAYEAWYKRDEGYSMRRGPDVWINNGQYAYAYTAGEPSAVRWTERIRMNDDNPFIQGMQLPNFGLPTKRVVEADRVIRGQPCQAYEYRPGPKDNPLTPNANQVARLVLWMDNSHRIERTERQLKKGTTWKTDLVSNIEYDVPVPSSRFDPTVAFGPAVKILDAERAFDDRFGLAHAIYKQDVGGLWYAVHEFKACADGMILVVSSVRRDEQTEEEFPPQYRSIRPGMMIAEPGWQQFEYSSQIELASAVHGPVLVQWWLLAPLPVYGRHGLIKSEPGKVMFRAELMYDDLRLWHKYQPGATVMKPVELLAVLDAPSRETPLHRPELAAYIYRDLASLQRFALATLVLGIEKDRQVSKDPDETTQQEYTGRLAAYLNMREHQSNDQLLRELQRLRQPESRAPANPRTDKPVR